MKVAKSVKPFDACPVPVNACFSFDRTFDDSLREEPLVYRLMEAVMHYGEVRANVDGPPSTDGYVARAQVPCGLAG